MRINLPSYPNLIFGPPNMQGVSGKVSLPFGNTRILLMTVIILGLFFLSYDERKRL